MEPQSNDREREIGNTKPEKVRAQDLTAEERAALETRFLDTVSQCRDERIQPRIDPSPVRLSSAQERLWFLEQLEPGTAMYNVPWAFRLHGPLDHAAVQRSLDRIVARHMILRSTVAETEGIPYQVIGHPRSVPLTQHDLSRLSPVERNVALEALFRSATTQPFDLGSDLMIRSCLVRLEEDDHALLFVCHHIAADGWSRSIFNQEFSQGYRADLKRTSSSLAELPIQYADYAVWQRSRLQSTSLQHHLAYWRDQFASLPQDLRLPTYNASQTNSDIRGSHVPCRVAHELTERLRELARQEDTTLFMALLTGFAILLSRYTGETDLVLGTPIAGRLRSETEKLIGLFANTLALRVDMLGSPTFREALRRVRKTCLRAYEHQEAPFEEVMAQIATKRGMIDSPLLRAVLVLQNMPAETLEIDGVDVSPMPVHTSTAKFDLTLSLHDLGTGLDGDWEFRCALLEEDAVTRMGKNLSQLLHAIVESPDSSIARLPMLDAAERYKVVAEWNQTKRPYPNTTIHRQFEKQASIRPEAVALICRERQMTYGELNTRANQLAHELIRRGVGPDVLVGLCLERSIEAVIAILGILKAGGAYVPLDPNYPQERLSFMLEDANVALLLTDDLLASKLSPCSCPVMNLNAESRRLGESPESNPEVAVRPMHLAYVMYTSGSTGKPKGVMIPHRGVLRLFFGIDYVRLDEDQVLLLLSTISFDASTFELWGGLLHGGRCVIYPDRIPTAHELGRILRENGVSVLWLTPALFNVFIDEVPEVLNSVAQLLVGGDALSLPHVCRALELLPDTQLINEYGPTESTAFTTCYPIPRELEKTLESVPIGRPIGNTTIYIVDEEMNPVPIGVTGELLTGGDGVARGYLGHPDLTTEQFIPDPFSEDPQDRLYRTGDLARYLPDGRIEFLGRMDSQIKLRGYRIELGEIEAALKSHPAVNDSIVLLREDTPEDKRLVAYVVAERESKPERRDLLEFLSTTLPEFMIPSDLIRLDAFPLAPSGKIDRTNLPHTDESDKREPSNVAEGTKNGDERTVWTETESRMAVIWAEVLSVESVGVHENFFALGGHSLLAMRLIARIQDSFGIELGMRPLFENPTIRVLCEHVLELMLEADSTSSPQRAEKFNGERDE